MAKPYRVTISPFIGLTEVKIIRTADGALIHKALHPGGTIRARQVVNEILDRETRVDTSAADRVTLNPAYGVSLRRSPIDMLLTRILP